MEDLSHEINKNLKINNVEIKDIVNGINSEDGEQVLKSLSTLKGIIVDDLDQQQQHQNHLQQHTNKINNNINNNKIKISTTSSSNTSDTNSNSSHETVIINNIDQNLLSSNLKGCIIRLTNLLSDKNPTIQINSSIIITYILESNPSSTNEIKTIVENGGVKAYLSMLKSSHSEVRINGLMGLGFIIRNQFLNNNSISIKELSGMLKDIISSQNVLELEIQLTAGLIQPLCQEKINLKPISQLFPFFSKILDHTKNESIIREISTTIYIFCYHGHIQPVIESKICSKLIEGWFFHESEVQFIILDFLSFMVTNEKLKDYFLNLKIISKFKQLIEKSDTNPQMIAMTCYILEQLTKNPSTFHSIIDLVPPMIKLLDRTFMDKVEEHYFDILENLGNDIDIAIKSYVAEMIISNQSKLPMATARFVKSVHKIVTEFKSLLKKDKDYQSKIIPTICTLLLLKSTPSTQVFIDTVLLQGVPLDVIVDHGGLKSFIFMLYSDSIEVQEAGLVRIMNLSTTSYKYNIIRKGGLDGIVNVLMNPNITPPLIKNGLVTFCQLLTKESHVLQKPLFDSIGPALPIVANYLHTKELMDNLELLIGFLSFFSPFQDEKISLIFDEVMCNKIINIYAGGKVNAHSEDGKNFFKRGAFLVIRDLVNSLNPKIKEKYSKIFYHINLNQ
eukprot:gene633-784_t